MADEPNPEPRVSVEESLETLRVRRVPKHSVFLVLGAAFGVLVALVLTFVFTGTQEPSDTGVQYTVGQVFGFLALAGAAVGLLLGGILSLILERTVGRRTRDVLVERERVRVEED